MLCLLESTVSCKVEVSFTSTSGFSVPDTLSTCISLPPRCDGPINMITSECVAPQLKVKVARPSSTPGRYVGDSNLSIDRYD